MITFFALFSLRKYTFVRLLPTRSVDEFEEESSQDLLGCPEEEQEDVADYIPGAITMVKQLMNIILLWSNKLKTSL